MPQETDCSGHELCACLAFSPSMSLMAKHFEPQFHLDFSMGGIASEEALSIEDICKVVPGVYMLDVVMSMSGQAVWDHILVLLADGERGDV